MENFAVTNSQVIQLEKLSAFTIANLQTNLIYRYSS